MFSQASQVALLAAILIGPFWTVAVFIFGIRWTKNSSGYLNIAAKSILLAAVNFIPTVALELQQKRGFLQKFGFEAVYIQMSKLWVYYPTQFITMFGVLAGVHYYYASANRGAT